MYDKACDTMMNRVADGTPDAYEPINKILGNELDILNSLNHVIDAINMNLFAIPSEPSGQNESGPECLRDGLLQIRTLSAECLAKLEVILASL